MDSVTIGDILKVADRITSIGLLLLFCVGFVMKWWVPGWVYREKVDECEGWRDVGLTAVPALREVVTKK